MSSVSGLLLRWYLVIREDQEKHLMNFDLLLAGCRLTTLFSVENRKYNFLGEGMEDIMANFVTLNESQRMFMSEQEQLPKVFQAHQEEMRKGPSKEQCI